MRHDLGIFSCLPSELLVRLSAILASVSPVTPGWSWAPKGFGVLSPRRDPPHQTWCAAWRSALPAKLKESQLSFAKCPPWPRGLSCLGFLGDKVAVIGFLFRVPPEAGRTDCGEG